MIPNKMENNGLERNPDGTVKSGVLNPNGRPKRKTLTELIHAKLDDTPDGWNKIVNAVVNKLTTDKEVLKTFWNYTDGMPVQKNVLAGDDEHPIKMDVNATLTKIYGSKSDTGSGEVRADR